MLSQSARKRTSLSWGVGQPSDQVCITSQKSERKSVWTSRHTLDVTSRYMGTAADSGAPHLDVRSSPLQALPVSYGRKLFLAP